MSNEPDKYKMDVNDRYQRGVALVASLSTASLVLPILFLKDIVKVTPPKTISDALTTSVYFGWALLAASIILGILYYYFSAKWVKLAWGKSTDICWLKTNEDVVEFFLDYSYLFMMLSFVSGLYFILSFIIDYISK